MQADGLIRSNQKRLPCCELCKSHSSYIGIPAKSRPKKNNTKHKISHIRRQCGYDSRDESHARLSATRKQQQHEQ